MTDTQTTTPLLAPAPPEMQEFAFLIGIWDVHLTSYKPDGGIDFEYDGVWRAEYKNASRMLFDEFTRLSPDKEEVSYSATLRTFCPETDQWEMVFLFSQQRQNVQVFNGRFENGEGIFKVKAEISPDRTALGKVIFSNVEKNSFEWKLESSLDNGETWHLGRTMSARRVL